MAYPDGKSCAMVQTLFNVPHASQTVLQFTGDLLNNPSRNPSAIWAKSLHPDHHFFLFVLLAYCPNEELTLLTMATTFQHAPFVERNHASRTFLRYEWDGVPSEAPSSVGSAPFSVRFSEDVEGFYCLLLCLVISI
ncbi:hypothetical protein VZT92_005113 [Zoarces viviparus]|uniref:Uncharacterized protein n=1 Tax=Zoarces viviparus TaxID=48416 RepID=A0AAW1FSZ7_ZOAVI